MTSYIEYYMMSYMKQIEKLEKLAVLATIPCYLILIFIFILDMDTLLSVIFAILGVLWIIAFSLMAYRMVQESNVYKERSKMIKEHHDQEYLDLEQYHKLLTERNSLLQNANIDLKATLERENTAVETKDNTSLVEEVMDQKGVEADAETIAKLNQKRRGRPSKNDNARA